jgi:FtsH-binding integral membrane protein
MENDTVARFDREMKGFFALKILNIVGAGLGMAFGIAWIVGNVTPLFSGQSVQILNIAAAGLALVGCVVAMRWLITSVELFSELDELGDKSEEGENADALTGRILRSIAWYRERKERIGELKWGSRVTGAFLLVSAVLQGYNLVTTLGTATQIVSLASVVGSVMCLVLGVAGLWIPSAVTRFVATWESRVEASDEAERKLGKLIEGS